MLRGRTFVEDLSAAASEDGGRVALVADGRRLTFGELERGAARVGRELRRLGVQRGDRVALVLPNGVAAATAIYGALRAGAAFAPLDPAAPPEALARTLGELEAAALVCVPQRAAEIRRAARRGGEVPVVTDLDALPDHGEEPEPPIDVDLAAVLYTSGSTGEPKGITLSHGNMVFVADAVIEYLSLGAADRVLSVLPLSYTYGLYQLLMSVRVRATLVLPTGPERLIELLDEERITGLPGGPAVFQALLSARHRDPRPLPHLRFMTNSGATLAAATVAAIRRALPDVELFLMYGLTETGRVAYLPPRFVDDKPTAVGVAIPGTEVSLQDDTGTEVEVGEIGELIVRGSHVMQGYWRDPAQTERRLRPGRWPWERVFATGDLFRLDGDGHLHFVARREDVIVSDGRTLLPREIEEVLHAAPGVRDVVVIGTPHEDRGEVVEAHVSPQEDGGLESAELRRYCAERLDGQQVPARVVIHDELPRTSHGKIDRAALKAAALR
jgi:long-chain acyl-CoA synthetase